MRRLIRNIFIIFFYFTGIPMLRRWYLQKRHGALLRVIAFHDVPDSGHRAFKNLVRWLKGHYNVVAPRDVISGNFSDAQTNLLLTFDDGYASWMRTVVPILREYNIGAIFFINSSTIGTSGYLSWDDVEHLHRQGFEVGDHTYGHINMGLTPPQEALQDIQRNRRALRERVGVEPRFSAYPFGDRVSVGRSARSVVGRAGYGRSFSILPGFNTTLTDPLLMHRDSLQPTMSRLLLRAWLMGSYDMIRRSLDVRLQ